MHAKSAYSMETEKSMGVNDYAVPSRCDSLYKSDANFTM